MLLVASQLVHGDAKDQLSLWEQEDDVDHHNCTQGHIEPPEVAPPDVESHGPTDNGADHQRPHVYDPVQGVPLASVMQEEDVWQAIRYGHLIYSMSWLTSNDGRLY